MAQIVEETITVTVSKLVKDEYVRHTELVDEAVKQSVEEAVQSIMGDAVVVEIK